MGCVQHIDFTDKEEGARAWNPVPTFRRSSWLEAGFLSRDGSGVHKGLQDEDGGHAIYRGGAFFDREFGFAEEAVGLDRGEALVPEMDGELELGAEVVGKFFDPDGLSRIGSGEAEGKADDDFGDIVIPDHLCELLEVSTLVAALEGVNALGGDAEQVGDGHADAAVADIESEEAAGLLGF